MCLVEEEEEEDEEQEERRERGREKEAVSQVETKEGEEALRFFRARDFETCLSALKSREIKEPRPKPGGHTIRVRGKGEGEEAMAAVGTKGRRRCMEYTKDGPTETRRGEPRQKVVRRSYTHHDSLSFVCTYVLRTLVLILLLLYGSFVLSLYLLFHLDRFFGPSTRNAPYSTTGAVEL